MQRENLFQDGPYVNSAFICDRILEEKDGVKTAVRIIDRITRSITGAAAPDEMPEFRWDGFLLVRLKTGSAGGGKHRISIRMKDPRGQEVQEITQSVLLEEVPDRGVDFVLRLGVELAHEGVYWFDIYFDDALLTRVPLRVIYVIRKAGTVSPPGSIQ